jgi:hypothetical protein
MLHLTYNVDEGMVVLSAFGTISVVGYQNWAKRE